MRARKSTAPISNFGGGAAAMVRVLDRSAAVHNRGGGATNIVQNSNTSGAEEDFLLGVEKEMEVIRSKLQVGTTSPMPR